MILCGQLEDQRAEAVRSGDHHDSSAHLLSPELHPPPTGDIACVVVPVAGVPGSCAGSNQLRGEGMVELPAEHLLLLRRLRHGRRLLPKKPEFRKKSLAPREIRSSGRPIYPSDASRHATGGGVGEAWLSRRAARQRPRADPQEASPTSPHPFRAKLVFRTSRIIARALAGWRRATQHEGNQHTPTSRFFVFVSFSLTSKSPRGCPRP